MLGEQRANVMCDLLDIADDFSVPSEMFESLYREWGNYAASGKVTLWLDHLKRTGQIQPDTMLRLRNDIEFLTRVQDLGIKIEMLRQAEIEAVNESKRVAARLESAR
jgi:hypothetical protein